MSDKKKSPPDGVKPSSSQPTSTPTSGSKENLPENLVEKVLPEILVTEEKEVSPGGRPEFLIEDTAKSQPSSTAPLSSSALSLDTLAFSPVKTDDKQLKIPPVAPLLSSSSDEALIKEELEEVRKVTSGYSEDSSSSPSNIPKPRSSKQHESKLLLAQTVFGSINRGTQTSWIEIDAELSSTENLASTTMLASKRATSPSREQASCSPGKRAGTPDGKRSPSPNRTYQTVFKCILQEMLARELQEADINVAPSARLKQETRRRLAQMFKSNFERYKDVFKRIINRRKTTITINTDMANWNFMAKYFIIPSPEEVSPVPSVEDFLEIDEGWLEEIARVHRGMGLPTFYRDVEGKKKPQSQPFSIFFPDGSGQILYLLRHRIFKFDIYCYPSGNLALIIFSKENTDVYTYLIFKDQRVMAIQAVINSLGHATFLRNNEEIWVCLTFNFGFYFYGKSKQKTWNWWDDSQHVHAPPYKSINLDLNPSCNVKIKTQDNLLLTFSFHANKIRLNVGTKAKIKDLQSEIKLKSKEILETSKIQKQVQMIKDLLKKMKKILNRLTKTDLEFFIKGSPLMSELEDQIRKGRLSKILLTR